jgi:hypothetical protein
MDKYELHNQKQYQRAHNDFLPCFTVITPATFDLWEQTTPEVLQYCIVSRFIPASTVEAYIMTA